MKLLFFLIPTLTRPDPIYAELRARHGMQPYPVGVMKKFFYHVFGSLLWFSIWLTAIAYLIVVLAFWWHGKPIPEIGPMPYLTWLAIAYRLVGARLNLAFMRWAGWGDDALAISGWTPPATPKNKPIPHNNAPRSLYLLRHGLN